MIYLMIITIYFIMPCQNQKSCLTSFQKSNPNHKFLLSYKQSLQKTLYNFSMLVDEKDNTISKAIKQQGTWKPSLIQAISYFVKSKFHVLNVGAQIGLEAIIMANIIGYEGKLYIMQPYSVSYGIIKKNIYLNNFENMTRIFRVAASDIQAKGQIIVDQQNTGGAQIHPKSISQSSEVQNTIKQEVYMDLIDNIMDEGSRIDFVLMDVQKMQVQALLGMKKLIQRSPNIILLVQWQYSANSHRNEAKTLRLLNWLKQKQFKIYEYVENKQDVCKKGRFKEIPNIPSMMMLGVKDILIIPKNIDPNNYN